ncbi:hypothetical protein SSCG_03055 [Streptomyces clavuligerus]|nr:hypothetical protein SSCG_03055 [Streptomyces clavuligerus]
MLAEESVQELIRWGGPHGLQRRGFFLFLSFKIREMIYYS